MVIRPDAFRPDPSGAIVGTVAGRTYRGDHFLIQLDTGDGLTLEVVVRWDPVPERGEQLRLAVDENEIFAVKAG